MRNEARTLTEAEILKIQDLLETTNLSKAAIALHMGSAGVQSTQSTF